MNKEQLLESIIEFNETLQEAREAVWNKEKKQVERIPSATRGAVQGGVANAALNAGISKLMKQPRKKTAVFAGIGAATGAASGAVMNKIKARRMRDPKKYRNITSDVQGVGRRLRKTARAGFKVFGTHAKAERKAFNLKQKVRDKIDKMKGQ